MFKITGSLTDCLGILVDSKKKARTAMRILGKIWLRKES
jgi:hypothetical protein